MPSADFSVADVLGCDGLIAKALPGYESRPQQLSMAEIVGQAISERQHAIVEAPTGVGKSFAYLVPALLHALSARKKVVISTGTISLQEQLVRKDIPLLQKLFPELKAVLVKGRQNYISLRRLAHALTSQQSWSETGDDARTLRAIADWSEETKVGDLADLGYQPPSQVWRHVVSDRNNCQGRKCPTYNQCFFYQARKELEEADLLIVNHHLYFSDLALREEHAGILPAHDVVIFDEAHTLEDIATDHLGSTISEAQVRFFLDGLYNRRGRGLLSSGDHALARQAVEEARGENEKFWAAVAELAPEDSKEDSIPIAAPDQFDNALSPVLDQIATQLNLCRSRALDDNSVQEFRAQADRATGLAGSLRAIVGQQMENYVYYAEIPRRDRRGSISLRANPLTVASLLDKLLFKQMPTVVLTSATLAADDSERFLFLRKRLGVEGGLSKRLDSPFDFTQQVKLLLNQSPLDPNSPRYEQALAAWLADYLSTATGGTFILFTSYRQLDAVYQLVRPSLESQNRFVLKHGDGMGRSQMLDLFKRIGNAVLFGTSSFWEGVDVQGDALRNVIITKLPFEVPNHPLVEARHREIQRLGGNPFIERTVPEAILRLKQGFGRLIRTKTDSGNVVICDHRVLTKAYGRYFLKALPECTTEVFSLERYL
jgi:ATP-dependent DNA helicase DinG